MSISFAALGSLIIIHAGVILHNSYTRGAMYLFEVNTLKGIATFSLNLLQYPQLDSKRCFNNINYIHSFIPRTLNYQALDCMLVWGGCHGRSKTSPEMTPNLCESLTGEADVSTN